VKTFEPYKLIQEPNEPARAAMVHIAGQAIQRKKPAFLFINNRLEGNAPGTIDAVTEQIELGLKLA
jgi:hypothetical protein